jgi:protein tyrosine phosphatase
VRLVIVRFPDGTAVQATGLERADVDADPQFGLYLDKAWGDASVTWTYEVLDWPDFGTPADPDRAESAIVAAFQKARSGQVIEVGCLGGSGRTGTVLACMAILSGIATSDAVDWVRGSYRRNAVETQEQQDFVRQFGLRRG